MTKRSFPDFDAADQFGMGEGMGYAGVHCPNCRSDRTHYVHGGIDHNGRGYDAYSCSECQEGFRVGG